MSVKKQNDVIRDITEQTLLTLDGVAEEITKQTVQEEVDNFIAERTLKENSAEVIAIANKVAQYKKGDKTNFGVVVEVTPSSITFKAKDTPKTKIVFNQRKMGSKDYILSSLSKLNESMDYMGSMDDMEAEEEETIESLAAKLELSNEQVETLAAKSNEKYEEQGDAVLLDMLKMVAMPTDEEHKSAMMELIFNGDFDALEAHIAEMKAKEESDEEEMTESKFKKLTKDKFMKLIKKESVNEEDEDEELSQEEEDAWQYSNQLIDAFNDKDEMSIKDFKYYAYKFAHTMDNRTLLNVKSLSDKKLVQVVADILDMDIQLQGDTVIGSEKPSTIPNEADRNLWDKTIKLFKQKQFKNKGPVRPLPQSTLKSSIEKAMGHEDEGRKSSELLIKDGKFAYFYVTGGFDPDYKVIIGDENGGMAKLYHINDFVKNKALVSDLLGEEFDEEESEMNEASSYLDKLKKLNPGWDPEEAKGDFQNEYDPDDAEDAKDHADYLKSADKFLDDISSFKPGVKIGDWVEIYIKNSPVRSKIGIGKIIAEKTLKGHDYGYMGYKGPSNIPGWQVKAFVEDVNGDYEDKQANDYVMFNGKTYMNIGSGMFYIQHEENQKDKFKKLSQQNLKFVTIDEQSNMKVVTTDIDELVSGEEGLTEGFKEKASIIFEAAVASKVKETKSLLKEQYAMQLQEEVESIKETLVEKIDSYLTYAVETWVDDNKVAVESTLRTEITESFIGSLKNIFTEHYIEVPESKVNVVANMEAQLSALKEQVDRKGRIANALADRVEKLTRQKVIAEASAGLADTQIAKLTELVEDVEFINEDTFAKKVSTIREFYVNRRAAHGKNTLNENVDDNASFISKETIVENQIDGESLSPSMQNYLSAMSRMNKATTANLIS